MVFTKKISKSQFELLAEFRYLLRRFAAFSEHEARSAGIAPQQHQALLVIAGMKNRDSASIGEIAERLQIEPHSAVGLVNRLSGEGWVERVKDETDHRRVLVRLTVQGWEVLERLSAAHQHEVEQLAPDLIALLKDLQSAPRAE